MTSNEVLFWLPMLPKCNLHDTFLQYLKPIEYFSSEIVVWKYICSLIYFTFSWLQKSDNANPWRHIFNKYFLILKKKTFFLLTIKYELMNTLWKRQNILLIYKAFSPPPKKQKSFKILFNMSFISAFYAIIKLQMHLNSVKIS